MAIVEPPDVGMVKLWKQVTQVCHVWRETAINYPHLWSRISFVAPKWGVVSLERSKNVPIKVMLPRNKSYRRINGYDNLLTDALLQPDRITTLDLYGDQRNLKRWLQHIKTASSLQTLSLE
ncbi:hypothetical protein FA15DRAFT_632851, partial [Coprinopsis marcescibilis]